MVAMFRMADFNTNSKWGDGMGLMLKSQPQKVKGGK